jgi:hypothetical protein
VQVGKTAIDQKGSLIIKKTMRNETIKETEKNFDTNVEALPFHFCFTN